MAPTALRSPLASLPSPIDLRRYELGFEYHWRLDDDSELTSRVGYDVFELMHAHSFK